MSRPPADPNAFAEAVAWFRKRVPLTDEEYAALDESAQEKAFTVAGVAQLDVVTDVYEAIDAAVAQGTTLEDFRKEVAEKLTAAWGSEQPWRVETIARTNVQLAYSAGRYEQQTDPAVKAARPYWKFSATLDGRTSEICEPLDGVTLPADDPFWSSHQPPLHFNCRSTIISLTEEQADKEGVDEKAPDVAPAEGFGDPPEKQDWQPDLSEYPDPLAEIARDRLAGS